MGVDEGVEVGVHGFVGVVIVNGLGDRGGLDNRGSDGLDWSLNRGGGLLSDKGGRVLSVSSRGDVGTLENPEAVLAGSVPHSDGVPVLANVAVLPNPDEMEILDSGCNFSTPYLSPSAVLSSLNTVPSCWAKAAP